MEYDSGPALNRIAVRIGSVAGHLHCLVKSEVLPGIEHALQLSPDRSLAGAAIAGFVIGWSRSRKDRRSHAD